MRKVYLLVMFVISLSIFCAPWGAVVVMAEGAEGRAPRIAIGNFEYKGVLHLKDGTRAFVDMISTALMQTRRFELVERDRVKEALKEIGLGEAGVVNPADSQRLGNLLKADLILFGTITQASLDNRAVSVPGLSTRVQEMRMAVDIRIIDAKTGEVKTAETVTRSKTSSEGVNVEGTIAVAEGSTGIVGDVMRDVASDVVRKLVSGVYPIVIDHVQGNQVRLNYGAPVITENTIYNVYDSNGFMVGSLKSIEVRGRDSLAEIVSGQVDPGMVCREAGSAAIQQAQPREIPW